MNCKHNCSCPCSSQTLWFPEEQADTESIDDFAKVVLIVEEGSVKSKPDYVDLIEIKIGASQPVVVRNGGF